MLESDRVSQTIAADKNAYPKYCMKMATGTGKTWVLQTLMIWQILNVNRYRDDPRFTRNFLVVAPGLIVYDRLLDAFMGKERGGKPMWGAAACALLRENNENPETGAKNAKR